MVAADGEEGYSKLLFSQHEDAGTRLASEGDLLAFKWPLSDFEMSFSGTGYPGSSQPSMARVAPVIAQLQAQHAAPAHNTIVTS
jgi:hypothetical protein